MRTTLIVLVMLLLSTPVSARIIDEPTPYRSASHWATPAWQRYAGHIVAGESPAGCQECDQVIACTLINDVKRGYSPWRLHPGRWHGWRKHVTPAQQRAVSLAVTTNVCFSLPVCKFLGNARDFQYNWTHLGPGTVWGNRNGLVICVEEER